MISPNGPAGGYGPPGSKIVVQGSLLGVLSPHIDLHRGGPAFAWAYGGSSRKVTPICS